MLAGGALRRRRLQQARSNLRHSSSRLSGNLSAQASLRRLYKGAHDVSSRPSRAPSPELSYQPAEASGSKRVSSSTRPSSKRASNVLAGSRRTTGGGPEAASATETHAAGAGPVAAAAGAPEPQASGASLTHSIASAASTTGAPDSAAPAPARTQAPFRGKQHAQAQAQHQQHQHQHQHQEEEEEEEEEEEWVHMVDAGSQAGSGLAELKRSGSGASRPGSATSRLGRPTSAHSPPDSSRSPLGSARRSSSFGRQVPRLQQLQLQQLAQLKAGAAADEALVNRLAELTGSELVGLVSVQHQPSVAAAMADRGMADEFAKKHNR